MKREGLGAAGQEPSRLQQRGVASETTGQAHGQDQTQVVAQFRTALEPHGRWQRHQRWGDVWTPANRPADWRPYTVGHWVYTRDWGWYWIADEDEAPWGVIAFHYGRWVYDPQMRWIWIPRSEWSPGWVTWRRDRSGTRYVGWAPLPPDEIIVEYVEQPEVWVFVRASDFTGRRIAPAILPMAQVNVALRETVIVNRTVALRDRPRIAVNPGIEPGIIAASVGQPVRVYNVRPTVLSGTVQISGATEVQAEAVGTRKIEPMAIQEAAASDAIKPMEKVPDAQPLKAQDTGRLGDNPPLAAKDEAGLKTDADVPGKPDPKAPETPKPMVTPDQKKPLDQPDAKAPGKPDAKTPDAPKTTDTPAPKSVPGKPDPKAPDKPSPKAVPDEPDVKAKDEPKPKAAPETPKAQESPQPKAAPKMPEVKPQAKPDAQTPKAESKPSPDTKAEGKPQPLPKPKADTIEKGPAAPAKDGADKPGPTKKGSAPNGDAVPKGKSKLEAND